MSSPPDNDADERVRRDLHEQNRRSWNRATQAHNGHKRDQAAFLRSGGLTLFPEERSLLGELSGRSLLHLSCNCGQDTLSLARLGARVTGVDISDEAVAFATQLAADSALPGRFERADVYDWLPRAAHERRSFDRVFMSYGVLGWLSDLATLFAGVARVLAPGGRLVLVEFHPFALMLDEQGRFAYPYTSSGVARTEAGGVGDYVGLSGSALSPSGWEDGEHNFVNVEASHEFQWSLADVVAAVLRAGLRLEQLHEWPYANGWQPLAAMRDLGAGRFAAPATHDTLPLMFGLSAAR
jgi:SAM-dependent methyltransferase